MNKGIICGILLSACLFTQNAQAERVIISTEKTSLVLDAAVGGNLNFAYFPTLQVSKASPSTSSTQALLWMYSQPVVSLSAKPRLPTGARLFLVALTFCEPRIELSKRLNNQS